MTTKNLHGRRRCFLIRSMRDMPTMRDCQSPYFPILNSRERCDSLAGRRLVKPLAGLVSYVYLCLCGPRDTRWPRLGAGGSLRRAMFADGGGWMQQWTIERRENGETDSSRQARSPPVTHCK